MLEEMDEGNIYDELDEIHNYQSTKGTGESAELQNLKYELHSEREQNADLRMQIATLSHKNMTMETNFQQLLATVRSELAKKDELIGQLRREKDELVFRRREQEIAEVSQYSRANESESRANFASSHLKDPRLSRAEHDEDSIYHMFQAAPLEPPEEPPNVINMRFGESSTPEPPIITSLEYPTYKNPFKEENGGVEARIRSLQESIRLDESNSRCEIPLKRVHSPITFSANAESLTNINDESCDLREVLNRKNHRHSHPPMTPKWYDDQLQQTGAAKYEAFQRMKATGAPDDVKAYKEVRKLMNKERAAKKMQFYRSKKNRT